MVKKALATAPERVVLYSRDGRGVMPLEAGAIFFGFAMAYVWFKVSDLITPIRVPADVELEGLDGPEMGTLGYPDFQLHPSTTPGYAAMEAARVPAAGLSHAKKVVIE